MKLTHLALILLNLNLCSFCSCSFAQPIATWYNAELQRKDGAAIVFQFQVQYDNQQMIWKIKNADELITVNNIQQKADSFWVDMPVFESAFRIKWNINQTFTGEWIKGTEAGSYTVPFYAHISQQRFEQHQPPQHQISGKWEVAITRSNGTLRPAIGLFQQNGSNLKGTFLTPSGDYRFLEGVVDGNQIKLSCFDGSHAYLFTAEIANNNSIINGVFYAGTTGKELWNAQRNEDYQFPDSIAKTFVLPGKEQLAFKFKDLNGQLVSFNDARFKNKVILVQIMGSWCPNCMDETAFLSEFYKNYKNKGVEIVALAYEYTTNFERSKNSVLKFKKQFNVQYPMLITGVSVSDEEKTEKTLPQLNKIYFYPTLLYVDKKGKIQFIHQGFYGPGSGNYFEAFKKEFYNNVERLLQQ